MQSPECLARLRTDKSLTQQALADLPAISLIQIHRYENGGSQRSLEALRKLAKGLSVSADTLVFEDTERGPDDELKLQFEAVSQFDPDEKQIVKALLDSLILKHRARRWAVTPENPKSPATGLLSSGYAESQITTFERSRWLR